MFSSRPRFVAAIAVGALVIAGTSFVTFGSVASQAPLKIVVIAGEGAVNIIQQKTAVAPIVEVRDRNDQPVAGAVVRFAIQGGRGSFNGARVLSLTTDVAGRAAATGLTPTASGALQISASAAFQGQTAVVAIAQTNVMTAAEAAAVAAGGATSSGGGAAGAGGAAGGGGGGLSATTIAIIGGAAAGGAIAVKAVTDGSGNGTTYTGTYSGQIIMATTTPGCTFVETLTGKVTIQLDDTATTVSGTADVEEKSSVTSSTCGNVGNSADDRVKGAAVTGTAAAFSFTNRATNTFQGPGGLQGRLKTISFTGALNGSEVTGTLVTTDENFASATPSGTPTVRGSSSIPITLR